MNHLKYTILALSLAASAGSYGSVYLSNTGSTSGWDKVYTQQIGRIFTTSSPSYKGSCIGFEQTWNNVQTGYHSECIKNTTQSANQDRYYGKIIYLPSNWYTESANYTFSQYSPENPEGPWLLNYVAGTNIKIIVPGVTASATVGGISKGVWTRVVVRLKLSNPGIEEVWLNGTKKLSYTTLNLYKPNGSSTIRWSNGIYCTGWRTATPPNTSQKRVIYQDQFRVTSTYSEADPAKW